MNELVDVVTATLSGPNHIGVGATVDVSARFSLDGPSGATLTDRAMAWGLEDPLGGHHSITSVDPVIEETDYSQAIDGSHFPSAGLYRATVTVTSIFDPPAVITTDSNILDIHVLPIRGEGEIDLPATSGTASLPAVVGDAELPPASGVASLPEATGDAAIDEHEGTAS